MKHSYHNFYKDFFNSNSLNEIKIMISKWQEMRAYKLDLFLYTHSVNHRSENGSSNNKNHSPINHLTHYWDDKNDHRMVQNALNSLDEKQKTAFEKIYEKGESINSVRKEFGAYIDDLLLVSLASKIKDPTILNRYLKKKNDLSKKIKEKKRQFSKDFNVYAKKYAELFDSDDLIHATSNSKSGSKARKRSNIIQCFLFLENYIEKKDLERELFPVKGGKKFLEDFNQRIIEIKKKLKIK